MKSLIVKILPVTLHWLVPVFRNPPVNLKVVPKAVCDSENCFESRPLMYTGEIQPMRVKKKAGTEI
jgi:hypothetical protein